MLDNPFISPSVLSLCTGMRGLERGLERAIGSVRVAAYVEIEAFIIYNLVRQMEQGLVAPAPVWSNLKTFPAQQFHRKIHWVIGGYPCQPFSVAGKQQGTEDPRHLWPYIKRAVKLIQPFGCFFENVPNHLNIGYREVRHDLEELGYTVKEGLYTAEEVGAPHERKRLFILALDYSYGCEQGEGRRDFTKMPGIQKGKWSELCAPLFAGTGTELADSYSKQQYWCGITGKGRRIEYSNSCQELAHTNNTGLQGWNSGELSECAEQLPFGTGDTQTWPAGQGEYQHPWEEQRTVKSGLGCTINGYNFREDLLRMYGNGVVEQTAGLAFIDLLNKHIKD